ncbi:MAG: hypothetical protein GEU82_13645 [Luteitalea sp.]|nr:hypothetical protein [Luteitalea sp.]
MAGWQDGGMAGWPDGRIAGWRDGGMSESRDVGMLPRSSLVGGGQTIVPGYSDALFSHLFGRAFLQSHHPAILPSPNRAFLQSCHPAILQF